ncbi:MAG: hypothetical protein ACOCQD_04155 [archaeon]
MKIRRGFVSNSSSASFIVKFKSSLPKEEIEKLITTDDGYLKSAWNKPEVILDGENSDIVNGKFVYTNVDDVPIKDKKLQANDEVYYYEADTIMFNDWTDVPGWKFVRLLSEQKHPNIELIEIQQTYDGHEDVDKKATFDPYVWDYEENKDSQFQTEREYVQYLADIGIEINNEELKKLLL